MKRLSGCSGAENTLQRIDNAMVNFPDACKKHRFCALDLSFFNIFLTKTTQIFREKIAPNQLYIITLPPIYEFLTHIS